MKIRSNYVSNSSSSSFIIIAKSGIDETESIKSRLNPNADDWNTLEIPNESCKHQFGWEWEDTHSFGGKLNFIGIQLLYLFLRKYKKIPPSEYIKLKYEGKDFDRLYDMLIKVCKEKFGINVKLSNKLITISIWKNNDEYVGYPTVDDNFYIDHQSACTEGRCMEMFDSEEALYDFLRYEESYVQGGNDNC